MRLLHFLPVTIMTINQDLLDFIELDKSFIVSYLQGPSKFYTDVFLSEKQKYKHITAYILDDNLDINDSEFENYLIVKDVSALTEHQKNHLSKLDEDYQKENYQVEDGVFASSDFEYYCQLYFLDYSKIILITNPICFYRKNSGFKSLHNKKYFNDFCVRNHNRFNFDNIKDNSLKEHIQNIKLLS